MSVPQLSKPSKIPAKLSKINQSSDLHLRQTRSTLKQTRYNPESDTFMRNRSYNFSNLPTISKVLDTDNWMWQNRTTFLTKKNRQVYQLLASHTKQSHHTNTNTSEKIQQYEGNKNKNYWSNYSYFRDKNASQAQNRKKPININSKVMAD